MPSKNPGRRRKYCSRNCERLSKRKVPLLENCRGCGVALNQTLKSGRPKFYCTLKCSSDARTRRLAEERRFSRPCSWCGESFVGETARVKYCSTECRLEQNRKSASERWKKEKESRPDFKSWTCAWCDGEIVVPVSYTGHGKYHEDCRKQAARVHNRKKTLKRQFVKTDLRVTHEEVAERDNWICYLCGEAVDMSLPRTSKMGATLDHVVPISRGGEDSLENLRLAHWTCNVRKSNKFLEELGV